MSTTPDLEFYDGASKRKMKYVYPSSSSQWAGWILYWHEHAGNWVSLRKATDDDIALINGAVVLAHQAEGR